LIEEFKNQDIVRERALLVGIYGPDTIRVQAEEYLDELERLTATAGGITVEKVLQNRTKPDPRYFIGKGKLREINKKVGAQEIDTIIFDDDLSPTQVRNIEQETNAKVLDRSGLILDIFASRAKTAAAKTQVELAQLQYLLPRLTRFWTHLSRQKGGIGTKGPGETQIETDRRLIDKRIDKLQDKLEKLEKQRMTQRKRRSKMTRISLVGYTNAGKSTLMNAITETELLAEDRLFATLDSTVRSHEINNKKVLISDTVGFIRKLPHDLIESFKSTLDEVRESNILLHVVDASSLMMKENIEVVRETLLDLDITDKRTLLVFNKVDKLSPEDLRGLKKEYPESAFISARRGIGLNRLEEQIGEMIEKDHVQKTLQIPMSKYKAVAFIHEVASIEKESYIDNKVEVTFSISPRNLIQLNKILQNGDTQPRSH